MEVVASLSQGRTAAAQCGLFTHKSVPVIFEPPCTTTQRDGSYKKRPTFVSRPMKFIKYMNNNSTSQKTHITNYKDKPTNAVRGNSHCSF